MDSFDKTVEMTESNEKVRQAGTDDLPFTIHRTEPYGFYEVKTKKISLPMELSGVYTSPRLAEEAIELYIKNLEKFAKEEEVIKNLEKIAKGEEVKADGQRTTQKPDGNGPARAKGRGSSVS